MAKRQRNTTERVVNAGDLLTPMEAARLLGVPRPTLYEWLYAGKIRAYRARGGWRLFLLKEDVEAVKQAKGDQYEGL